MNLAGESSYQSSCESDGDGHSSAVSPSYKVLHIILNDVAKAFNNMLWFYHALCMATTKLSEPNTPLDWTGVTTNSEECSYSSESRSESDGSESNRFASVVGDINWDDELAFSWEIHGVELMISKDEFSKRRVFYSYLPFTYDLASVHQFILFG